MPARTVRRRLRHKTCVTFCNHLRRSKRNPGFKERSPGPASLPRILASWIKCEFRLYFWNSADIDHVCALTHQRVRARSGKTNSRNRKERTRNTAGVIVACRRFTQHDNTAAERESFVKRPTNTGCCLRAFCLQCNELAETSDKL